MVESCGMSYFLQQIANAVPLATLYASLAFGYAIAFAVTRRADITYGAIFAFSGHLYVLVAHFGWNELRLVLPAALALGALAALSGGVATGMVSGARVAHGWSSRCGSVRASSGRAVANHSAAATPSPTQPSSSSRASSDWGRSSQTNWRSVVGWSAARWC